MKRVATVFALSTISMFTWGSTMESIGSYDKVANVDGEHVRIIQATASEFSKHQLDLKRYQVIVIDSGESWVVLYQAKGTLPEHRGSPVKGVPGFTVELKKKDLSVIRSNFVR